MQLSIKHDATYPLAARAEIELATFDANQARIARQAFKQYGKDRHPVALNVGDCFTIPWRRRSGNRSSFRATTSPRPILWLSKNPPKRKYRPRVRLGSEVLAAADSCQSRTGSLSITLLTTEGGSAMPLDQSDGVTSGCPSTTPTPPIGKLTQLHLLLGLFVCLGGLMGVIPSEITRLVPDTPLPPLAAHAALALQLLTFFAWGLGNLILPVWTWRLPFWPAPWVKWALWANAILWPLLWFPLTLELALVLTPLFCLGGPGLLLVGTAKAMGLRAAWSILYHRAAFCARRIPPLFWVVAASPFFWDEYTRTWWYLFIIVIAIGWGVVEYVLWLRRTYPAVDKERPDLLRAPETRHAVRQTCQAAPGVFVGTVDEQPLHVSVEDRASVIGPPGSGKTAFLVTQLLDWADSGQPFVCLDVKPEIYGIVHQRLESQGYKLLTYNPTARTGQRYNPLADLESPEAIGELAAVLVPSPAAEDAVFNESARDLLDAVITHLRATQDAPTLPDVRAFLSRFDSHRALMQSLRTSPDPDVVDLAHGLTLVGQNQRLLGSIFGTLRANLRFLRYPAVRDSLSQADFRLGDLCRDTPVGLFLQFEEVHQQTTALLFAAMVAHTLRYFIEHTARPPVLLLLDEIGNVPAIPALGHKLNTIRSRNLPTWLYWQSKEQMQRYGQQADEGPNLILGACDVQMIFRLNDNATADWMSEKIGTVDRVIRAASLNEKSGVTLSAQLQTEPSVRPHELQQLPPGEVVTSYRGLVWRGQAPAYFERWPEMEGKRPASNDGVGLPYKPTGSDVT